MKPVCQMVSLTSCMALALMSGRRSPRIQRLPPSRLLAVRTQLEKIKFYVDLAQKEGGKVALGGEAPELINERCHGGYFFQPTVITGLPVSCRTNREEIFGPVVTVTPFDSEEEVIQYANDCD